MSAAIQIDGDTISTGSTHSGNGWERLTHSTTATDLATSVKVGLHVTSASDAFVFYADELVATAGMSGIPQLLGNRLNTWREEGDDITIIQGIVEDRNILVRGMGLLSSVSSGSDTMEINEYQARYLYNIAASLWFQQDIDQLDISDLNAAQRRQTHFANLVTQGNGAMAPIALLRGVV